MPDLRPYADPLHLPVGVGSGFQEIVAVANPPAASGFNVKVPGQYRSLLLTVYFQMVSSATVGTRLSIVELRDPDNVVWAAGANKQGQVASQTRVHCYGLYFDTNHAGDANALLTAGLPWVFIPPGHNVNLRIDQVQAGDQVSNVRLTFLRVLRQDEGGPSRTHRPRQRRRVA